MAFKKIVMAVLTFVLALPLCSCSGSDNGPEYYVELSIVNNDVLHQNAIYPEHDAPVNLRAGEQLDEPIFIGLESDGAYLTFRAVVSVKTAANNMVVFSSVAQYAPINTEQFGMYIPEYTIIDTEGNEVEDSYIRKTFNTSSRRVRLGGLSLQPIAGIHTIRFTLPEMPGYGLKESNFVVSFRVDKDTREDGVEIVMDSDVQCEEIKSDIFEKAGGYPVYVCDKLPSFSAVLKSDARRGAPGRVDTVFRKIDEEFFYNEAIYAANTNERGIYLCEALYLGSERYQPVYHYCYVIW